MAMDDNDIDPVKVHVVRDDTKGEARNGATVKHTTTHTYQTTVNGGEVILNFAPNRLVSIITVLGVVGTNANVSLTTDQSGANTLSPSGEGQGAVLQPGNSIRHYGTDKLYVSALTGGGTPPLVSVLQVFEA
jgi:hypothetical protein